MHDLGDTVSRRQLLTLVGSGSLASITGCSGLNQAGQSRETEPESPHRPQSSAESPISNDGGQENPDRPPEITAYEARATEKAGELVVSLTATDTQGLNSISATIDGYTVTRELEGQTEATLPEQILSAGDEGPLTPGSVNEVTFRAEDAAGSVATLHDETYVRKYDKMQDTRLDIGAVYLPFAGEGMHRCMSNDVHVEPVVGKYGEPIPAEVTSQHIDQMTGHGINRLLYDFEGRSESFENARVFHNSELLDQIEVEPYYAKGALTESMDENWKEDVFPEDLPFLRDNFLARDNVAMYDDRPVLSTWNFVAFAVPGELQDKIMNDFGSYEAFVADMRSHLQVNGKDPFLVAGIGTAGRSVNTSKYADRLIGQFDAVSTWHPGNVFKDGEPASWEETYREVKEDYEGAREFVDERDMKFFPMIFPGNDNRGNTCYGGDRWIPRSQEQFKRLLHLAEEYQKGGRINIASWNDWLEGHQIEPGLYRGNDYGTAYVDIVKEFQNA